MIDDIQCKFTTTLDWSVLLEMEKHDKGAPKRRKAIVVNLGKMTAGKRTHKGKFVVMQLRDYLQMLAMIKTAEKLYQLDPSMLDPELQSLILKRPGHV